MGQEAHIGTDTRDSGESLLLRFFHRLPVLSRFQVRTLSVAMVLLFGCLDWLAGSRVAVEFFYVILLFVAVWYDGKRFGYFLSVLSAFSLFCVESILGISLLMALWTGISRLVIFAGVVYVVEELREMHRMRAQSEGGRYERILETAVEGVLALDMEGRVAHANPRALSLLGYEGVDLINAHCHRLVQDDASKTALDDALSDCHSQTPAQREIQFRSRGGDSLWTLVSAGPTFGAGGGREGVVLLMTDITARKREEEKLRQQYEDISALHHLSSVLTRSMLLSQRLEDALQSVLVVFRFDGGAIYLADEAREYLLLQHQIGLRIGSIETLKRWDIGCGITGQVCRSGQAQFIQDATLDVTIDGRVRAMEDLKAFASIPLEAKGEVLGVLNLFRRQPHTFLSEERSMLETIGRQIGVAFENARLYEEARARQRQLQHLSIGMIRLQEDERKRFARELHDGLAQLLTTMQLNAELALQNLVHRGGEAERFLKEVMLNVREAEDETKRIAYDLRPAILDDFGLKAALELHARTFQRRTGIPVDLHLSDACPRFDSVIEITVYRLVQELLANVAKHSGARQVVLQCLVRADVLALTISDNGKGFTYKEPFGLPDDRVHSGLRNVRERIESLGGVLRVETAPGKGAEFMIEIPCTLPLNGHKKKEMVAG